MHMYSGSPDIFFGAVTALGALYVRGRALLYPNNIAA